MRSLAVTIGLTLIWAACSGHADPTDLRELPDCLDSSRCGPGITPASPLGQNFPQPGVDAGLPDVIVPEVGVPQGSIPEAGAGPGISPVTGMGTQGTGPGSTGELGPVCPANAPTNGAPCDVIANSLPCAYARLTCFCVESWTCF